uniref:BTB domain-containing protein n=1 Tax=Panagrolaimus davidi TaxID=227884 RepID=A0A914PCC1_9BILA
MPKSSNSDIRYSEQYIYKMRQERFKTFKLQDPAKEHFDVTFEIEGKKLYAHSFILKPVSETMASMLSDHWTKKDEVVTIETCSYENFYQFIQFVYTGGCDLTNENVFKLVDMAEFYAVPFLKEFCHIFLSSMIYNVETIEEMVEFSEKYSLNRMKGALKEFIRCNLDQIIRHERFLSGGKLFVEFMSSIDQYSQKEKENVFEAVYKWTEHQVLKQKDAEDETFNLVVAVKDELSVAFPYIYSMDNTAMNYDFLMSFMGISYTFIIWQKNKLHKDKNWLHGENFNLIDSIKADLFEVIKIAKFYQMQNSFLINFVVAKGIITAEQARHVDDTRVMQGVNKYLLCLKMFHQS